MTDAEALKYLAEQSSEKGTKGELSRRLLNDLDRDSLAEVSRLAALEAALRAIEREAVIEGADQGDPNADSIERSQALDALADIRGIARNALAKARGEQAPA